MMRVSIVLLVALYATIGVWPAESFSPWFTASFYDLKFTLHRYTYCQGDLTPLRGSSLNETEYLVYHFEKFLDNGNYESHQLANVTALMDNICRDDQSYPISWGIDLKAYDLAEGKPNRCKAIDDALDSMYPVFRRAALNHSEPLDFSTIVFYPNPSNMSHNYNLIDLINTSWIKSETLLEHVCSITDSVKRYVQSRIASLSAAAAATTTTTTTTTTSSSPDAANVTTSAAPNMTSSSSSRFGGSQVAQKRTSDQQGRPARAGGRFFLGSWLFDLVFGEYRRMTWEGSIRLHEMQNRLSSGIANITGSIGSGVKSTGSRLTSLFGSRVNSTQSGQSGNATTGSHLSKSPMMLNSTQSSNFNKTSEAPSAALFNATVAAPSATTTVGTPVVKSSTTPGPMVSVASSFRVVGETNSPSSSNQQQQQLQKQPTTSNNLLIN